MKSKRRKKPGTLKRKRTTNKPGESMHFAWILIIVGTMLVGVWGTHRILYNRSLTLSDALIASLSRQESKGAALPIHVTVGETISLPIVEAGKVGGSWLISDTSANHVIQSARPGEDGNIILYGHNTEKVFGKLRAVEKGDIVRIRMTDGLLYEYQIVNIQEVATTQTQLLAPTKSEVLTIYTCTGLFDSKRLVITAVPR